MRNIKLTDGTVYQVDRCGAADGLLRLRILPPYELLDVVTRLNDPEATASIEHYFDGTETDHVFFEGYTDFLAMEKAGDALLVILREVRA